MVLVTFFNVSYDLPLFLSFSVSAISLVAIIGCILVDFDKMDSFTFLPSTRSIHKIIAVNIPGKAQCLYNHVDHRLKLITDSFSRTVKKKS